MGSAGGIPISIQLDAAGDAAATFIFIVGGAFYVGDSTKVTLINGAVANNVFWVTAGASSIGISAQFVGTLIVHGAVTVGQGATINGGRVLVTAGAISLSSNTISIKSASSSSLASDLSVESQNLQGSGKHQKTHSEKTLKTHHHDNKQHQ